jgi:hypothetical protein
MLRQGRYHRAVRKLVKLALIALGIRALWQWRARRRAGASAVTAAPEPADPADELRRRLAASRDDEAVGEAAAAATHETTVEERRTDVHEQARATLDDMKSADEG